MRPILALTQGDPAGIGPEILLRLLEGEAKRDYQPLLLAERSALDALRAVLPDAPWSRLHFLDKIPTGRSELLRPNRWPVLDPLHSSRTVLPGQPRAADARAALAALDLGLQLTRDGLCDALVTAPLNKAEIARHVDPEFRGHTDYLAQACGLQQYGRDYLMAFLAPGLQVALLSTHLPLRQAIDELDSESLLQALRCLHRHAGGNIAVAGLNPHAGEGGLMGREEIEILQPALVQARNEGIQVHGPESADSLFARARRGDFDWVLALYHDQGLIAVKTAAFGTATNWTLGLPVLRTSVDHGTAYDLAGLGSADAGPLRAAVETTVKMLRKRERSTAGIGVDEC